MSRDLKENDEDVVEMKKAIATGSAKEAPVVSSGTSVEHYINLPPANTSISSSTTDIMLLSSIHSHDCCQQGALSAVISCITCLTRIRYPPVHRLWERLQHELPAAMHPVFRLCYMRVCCEETWDYFIPRFRHKRRESLVPD